MHEAKAKAMDIMFEFSNKNPNGTWIDLHGLQVKYSETKTRNFLDAAKAAGIPKVEVITGAGNHSGAGGPKIKGAIEAIFTEQGLSYVSANEGSFHVTF